MSRPRPGTALFSRRRLLQLLGGSGLVVLAGCRGSNSAPRLMAAAETLPKLWQSTLPEPWRLLPLKPEDAQVFWAAVTREQVDLVAVTDGWLSLCPEDQLQPVEAGSLPTLLDEAAKRYLRSLGSIRASQVLPVGVSPWVMLMRHGDALQSAAKPLNWNVLLDPALKGRVVLPASPRLVIDLAARITEADALPRLRQQVLSFDDRQGMNWLLKDRARVVVLPLQRCITVLRRDPRLQAVLPESGAPLHWTLLVRPSQTREPIPRAWVEAAWEPPLQTRLLATGWRPPLRDLELKPLGIDLPKRLRTLLLPPEQVWNRCWSLPPLTLQQQALMVDQWRASSP